MVTLSGQRMWTAEALHWWMAVKAAPKTHLDRPWTGQPLTTRPAQDTLSVGWQEVLHTMVCLRHISWNPRSFSVAGHQDDCRRVLVRSRTQGSRACL